jgi:hypothetical protein
MVGQEILLLIGLLLKVIIVAEEVRLVGPLFQMFQLLITFILQLLHKLKLLLIILQKPLPTPLRK